MGSGKTVSSEQYTRDLDPEKKIELIKKQRKEQNTIRKWDYLTLKNNPREALTYYLQVAEKLPDDVIIKKKVAHAYFLVKDWKNAYTYFVHVPFSELKSTEQKEMLSALFLNSEIENKLDELYKIPADRNLQEYYFVVNSCFTGIHNCITQIEQYAWTGKNLSILKKTSTDASKVSPDVNFRNFAVAAKFYEYRDYLTTEKLTSEILEQRPDYDEVRKLQGFSLFELGRYNEAKAALLLYLEKKPNDKEAIAKLWEIAFAVEDYVTSNLYLNNAILAWYTPKTNLERRLAYNYSILGDTVGMMKVLSYLTQEPDASVDDFAVAISLALSNGENIRAYVWAWEGLKKHPNSPIILPLYINALRVLGKVEDAKIVIESLPSDLQNSPIILLERWVLAYDDQDYTWAKQYFQKVVDIDDSADFSIEAENYLNEIRIIEQEQLSSSWVNAEPLPKEGDSWWW